MGVNKYCKVLTLRKLRLRAQPSDRAHANVHSLVSILSTKNKNKTKNYFFK
jgi:hypothetical protein